MEKLLMIPGPIKFDKDVLRQMSKPTLSHLDAAFIEIFSEGLKNLKELFFCKEGQSFVVPGSGTLAMEMAACNFVESGDNVLVVNTGYFSERFAAIFERYGANVTQINCALGDTPSLNDIEKEIAKEKYKLLTLTHVDTSTGVLCDIKPISEIAKNHGILTIVDGVCSIGGEEFYQDEWGIDVCLTASQKAIGVPPGLAILMVSKRAIETFEERKSITKNYYCDFNNWLPIMKAYENEEPKYFATPPVNLIYALQQSTEKILKEGMKNRFKRHKIISGLFKKSMSGLKLKTVPKPENSAHTMTALYYPDGIDKSIVGKIAENGVVVAGGLHPAIKDRYFRIGHMGIINKQDILITINAIKKALSSTKITGCKSM